MARKIPKLSYRESRNQVLQTLGSRCARCGFADARALQIDHVAGGGVTELRALTWRDYHAKVLAAHTTNTGEYALLCANCNWIKRATNNENPRQRGLAR